ncbi:MAG: hypothetical protein JXB05_06665 [Myxococcaceae bacterium]|nr:hypothetical protein [Myxococcaceae bacterium]
MRGLKNLGIQLQPDGDSSHDRGFSAATPEATLEGKPEGALLFEEVQRWRSRWPGLLILLGGVLMASFGYQALDDVSSGVPIDQRSEPRGLLLLLGVGLSLLGLWLIALASVGGLIVQVRSDGLYVQHLLLTRRHRIPYETIASCEARTYRPILEFGGWGVRFGWGARGKAYNVSGDQGVQLVLTNGRRLLLGSRKAVALARAINEARR